MKINLKYVLLMAFSGMVLGGADVCAAPNDNKESKGEIIFKIHDVVPEKNSDGDVIYCNLGATFFNRTKNDVNNLNISLVWNDDVIGEIIDIENREERESKKNKSKEPRSRFSTSSFTSKTVSADLRLPPIKVNQQVTLKTKVDTDRCFILLNDMDVEVINCGNLSASGSKGSCLNLFQHVSSKQGEYYTDFKEISWENRMVEEDNRVSVLQDELNVLYDETVRTLENVTADVSKEDGKQ